MSDLIDRAAAIRIASGYCHPANVAKELAKLPSVQPDNDHIWNELSKVYNMDSVPDEAKSIIGDVMLELEGKAE